MGIGFGILLLAAGAVLALAVQTSVNGIDVQAVGVILMIAGIVGLVIHMAVFTPRRRRTVVTRDPYDTWAVRHDEVV